jgi:hypothetical protein
MSMWVALMLYPFIMYTSSLIASIQNWEKRIWHQIFNNTTVIMTTRQTDNLPLLWIKLRPSGLHPVTSLTELHQLIKQR